MNTVIEVLSVIGFGIAVIVVVYFLLFFINKRKAKPSSLLLFAIILACVTLPLRFMVVDTANVVIEGNETYRHIDCDFVIDQNHSEIKNTADVYAVFLSDERQYRIISISVNGVNFPLTTDYYFRGDESLVIHSKNLVEATLIIPKLKAEPMTNSFADRWSLISNGRKVFYIVWAALDVLLILLFITSQVHSSASEVTETKAAVHDNGINNLHRPTEVAEFDAKQGVPEEIRKYKELLDDGIITEEEFNAKKKQLLGI